MEYVEYDSMALQARAERNPSGFAARLLRQGILQGNILRIDQMKHCRLAKMFRVNVPLEIRQGLATVR